MFGVPEWVKKFKQKGVEIRLIRNHYYAYKLQSKWDPVKKKPKKVTGQYLGKVTQEGIIPPKHERPFQHPQNITVKEFGASTLIERLSAELRDKLKPAFPADWQALYCIAVMRFFHSSSLKNMQIHFENSSLSDAYTNIRLDSRTASKLLFKTGANRNAIVSFMKALMAGSEHVLVDVTAVFSKSEGLTYAENGRNSQHEFTPQVNMLLLFSKDKSIPVFFRLLPGSVPDVSSIRLTVQESGVENALFVGDKGFYSKSNCEALDEANVRYVLPLKRDSALIDYKPVKVQGKRLFDGHFFFQKRAIWFKESIFESQRSILFLDERLRVDEEQGYLERIDKPDSDATEEGFHERQHAFGTITVVAKTSARAEEVYQFLKSRLGIETAFDAFKNVLDADRTFMQTDNHLQGWMFVNFIGLYLYYVLYGLLLHHKLLNNNSPKDVVLACSKVYKVKLNDRELITEVPKKTRLLLERIGVPLIYTESSKKDKPIT